MKKTILAFATILSLGVFTTMSLSSCSGDDGTDEIKDGTAKESAFGEPSDHLPKEASFFYGFWATGGGPTSFILYPDGTCKGFDNQSANSAGTGEWTYNTTTNILSTTIKSSQYQVTLCNKKGTAWTGVQLGSNLAQTFQMSNPTLIILSGSKWTDGSNTMTIGKTIEIERVYVKELDDFRVTCSMEYGNNYDKSYSLQYIKRLFEFSYYIKGGITSSGLVGTYKVKSYVSGQNSYRWVTDSSGSFNITDYFTPTPTLRLSSSPSSEYHLAD